MGLKIYKDTQVQDYTNLEAGNILAGIPEQFNTYCLGFQKYTDAPTSCTSFVAQKLNHITYEVETETTLSSSLISVIDGLYVCDYQALLGVTLDNSIYRYKFVSSEGTFLSEPFKCIDSSLAPVIEKILLTMDMSTPSTATINLTFASGALQIDWKDGAAVQNFATGVNLAHTYTVSGTYIAEITGNFENITAFLAHSSKITTVTGLQTGLLTNLQLHNNLISGVLDLSEVLVSNLAFFYNNPSLTGITFASTGNQSTDIEANDCYLTGVLNLANVPTANIDLNSNPLLTGVAFASSGNVLSSSFVMYSTGFVGVLDLSNKPIASTFNISDNPLLTAITFASTGNYPAQINVASTGLIGTLDLSNNPVSGTFSSHTCPALTGITFAASNTILTSLYLYGSNLTGGFSLASVPVSGTVRINGNSLLTGITFASTGNGTVTTLNAYLCDLTGTLDLSNVPLAGVVSITNNANLTNVTFSSSGNGALTSFDAHDCALTNLDFSVFATSNGVYISLTDNNMSATEVDNQIISLDATGWTGGVINIDGNNAGSTAASAAAITSLMGKGWTGAIN